MYLLHKIPQWHTYCCVYELKSNVSFLQIKKEDLTVYISYYLVNVLSGTSFYTPFILSCCFELLTSTDVSIRRISYRKKLSNFNRPFFRVFKVWSNSGSVWFLSGVSTRTSRRGLGPLWVRHKVSQLLFDNSSSV